MAQHFEGAQPQVVRGKQKFKDSAAYKSAQFNEDEEMERETLNIMHDKRVFRGNTHNMNLLSGNAGMSAA